jgi:hypothetical protein
MLVLRNSVAFSQQVNYTDLVTATGRRILVPTFVDRGMSRGQHGRSSMVVNLSFLDRKYNVLVVRIPDDGQSPETQQRFCSINLLRSNSRVTKS